MQGVCFGQEDLVSKAYHLLQVGNADSIKEAKTAIDAYVNDEKNINDGQAWYIRGFVYKSIYNLKEKENKESPSRITALESFKKSIEVDTSKVNVDENIKNIKYLATTLYNDAAATLNENEYNTAIRDFEQYRKYYILVDSSKSNMNDNDVRFKNALATVFTQIYEKNNHDMKFYNLALLQYEEILNTREDVAARYNTQVLMFNRTARVEKEKLQHELEMKSAKISLLDKENELKKMTLNEKEYQINKQNLEADKKSKELKLANINNELLNKSKQMNEVEIKQQKLMRNIFVAGLLLMIIFAGFIFRSLRIRNKQNKIIVEQKHVVEKQKTIVEAKNKEITDSIEYALRIQTAILPPQRIVKQYLENSFILYKPKDIVAGDFYWMETVQFENENQFENLKMKDATPNFQIDKFSNSQIILFAACDCTGHGVPGAMVSVVCHNALNRSVREFGLIQPAAILDKTAEIVIENFSKSEEDIKDGMDISLCSYNTKTKELQWAGANNPLWIVSRHAELVSASQQNNEMPKQVRHDGYELIETKADKQPIGMNEDSKPFTNHTFTLNSGDVIYLFTDGFADQFGGETGEKKLTRKRFKEVVLSIQNKSMQEQGIALDKFIVEYRKEVEQIDDILVMGVKV